MLLIAPFPMFRIHVLLITCPQSARPRPTHFFLPRGAPHQPAARRSSWLVLPIKNILELLRVLGSSVVIPRKEEPSYQHPRFNQQPCRRVDISIRLGLVLTQPPLLPFCHLLHNDYHLRVLVIPSLHQTQSQSPKVVRLSKVFHFADVRSPQIHPRPLLAHLHIRLHGSVV